MHSDTRSVRSRVAMTRRLQPRNPATSQRGTDSRATLDPSCLFDLSGNLEHLMLERLAGRRLALRARQRHPRLRLANRLPRKAAAQIGDALELQEMRPLAAYRARQARGGDADGSDPAGTEG